MNIWHDIPRERITSVKFPVYITIAKGSNKKYKFDTQTGCLQLTEMLYSAACYPVNGGIIPRTQDENKSPLEALVVCQEPLELHTLVECSPVGMIKVQEKERVEEKILAIPILENTTGMGFVEAESALKSVYQDIHYFYNTYSSLYTDETHTSGELSGINAADRIEIAMKSYEMEYGEE